MGKKPVDTPCRLKDSRHCRLIASGDCADCPCGAMSEGKLSELVKGMDWALARLPEGGPEALASGKECLFCAGEKKPASCYGFLDFALVDPAGEGSPTLKKDGKKAYVVGLQVPCCEDCRKNFRKLNAIVPACSAVGVALGLLFGMVLPLRNAVAKVHVALPLVLAVALGALGFFLGKALRKSALARLSQSTDLSCKKVGFIRQMKKNGWFSLRKDGALRPVFSKKPRKHSWFV